MYIIVNILIQISGSIIMKFAANSLKNKNILLTVLLYFIAMFLFFIQAVIWQKILEKYQLYFAYLWNGVFYIGIVLSGYFIFKEDISLNKMIALFIILFGLVIVSFAKMKKIEE